jgi:hypothetical protein
MNKKLLLFPFILISAVGLQSTGMSSPLVSVGQNTDIFFNSSVSLRHNSNIYRVENNTTSDLLTIFSPGVEVRYGGRTESQAQIVGNFRYDVLRYDSESRLNTENWVASVRGTYNTARLQSSARISFEQLQSPSQAGIQDLIQSERFTLGADGEYRYSAKVSVGSGLTYEQTKYRKNAAVNFSDRDSYTLPINVYYELTPKMDVSLGYRFRYTDVDDRPGVLGYTTKNHFFNVGLRGELLPKVDGFFRVGYTRQNSSRANINSQDTLGLNSELTWAATPKTVVSLAASRDFSVAGEGNTTEVSRISTSAVYSVTPLLSINGRLGWTLREYKNNFGGNTFGGREDTAYDVSLRSAYRINNYWTVSGGYTFEDNDSNRAGLSYRNHIFDLSVGLRY